jgi:hypothetical protein
MIINGGCRRNAQFFAKHLVSAQDNERVTLCEIRKFAAESIADAFREMEAIAMGSQCRNFFYHANLNPESDRPLSAEQWKRAVDLLESNLGLAAHARLVVEHEKKNRVHRHVIWLRIIVSTMRVVSMTDDYEKHQATSRQLEREFGHTIGRSVLGADTDPGSRPARRPKSWESFRGRRSGLDPHLMTQAITSLYRASADASGFLSKLAEYEYRLTRGDRADFCVIDSAGHVHSLARRLQGVPAAELRAFMQPLSSALQNQS